jgi:hypothetical protein
LTVVDGLRLLLAHLRRWILVVPVDHVLRVQYDNVTLSVSSL